MNTPLHPGQPGNQFDLLPAELSDRAQRALIVYQSESGGHAEPDLLRRTSRTIGSLAEFALESFSERAFDAAALQMLEKHVYHPSYPYRHQAALRALRDYFTRLNQDTQPSRRPAGYVGTQLGDMIRLDEAASGYQKRLAEFEQEDVLLFAGDKPIPQRTWLNLQVGANIPEIANVQRMTNVESQLARTAFVADHVVHPSDDDRELFKNILEIETFYSALLEVYGLHAFDMMVQSNASKKRVEKSGNEQVLEEASNLLNNAKRVSTEDIMKQFFGATPNEHLFQTSKESLYDETIIFSSTALEDLTGGDQSGVLNARFKTVGSYALKQLRNRNYSAKSGVLPADVYGMLAVLPDETQLGAFFASTVAHADRSSAIEFTTAGSKEQPIYIKGSPGYVEQIYKQLPSDILPNVQIKVDSKTSPDHQYQVAKFTSKLRFGEIVLPVEFQFQTAADRANARFGVPSHMNHNAGEGIADIVPGSADDLHTMFISKHKIDSNGERVNRRSIPHGEAFRELLFGINK